MPLDKLLQWAEAKGVVLTNVKFQHTESQGWGASPIEEGVKSSIHLPNNVIITPAIAKEVIKRDVPSVVMMKTLVALWKNGESSFKPYFDLLPSLEEIGSPLTLTSQELHVYKGTNLNEVAIKSKLRSLESDWQLVRDLIEFHDFLFGHLIVSSRAFPLNIIDPTAKEDEVMLLPLVDLLNHKPRAKVDWLSDRGGFTIETSNIVGDSQLWNNYGPKGNEELLMGYGFVIEDNEFDLLHLTLHLNKELIGKIADLGIEITKFNDYTTHEQVTDTGEEEGIVFIVNNFHPLPKGLTECFALSSPSEAELKLSNTLNGIQDLKSMLKLKFKGSLDVLPKKPESMNEAQYETAAIYRRGQLKMYNLLMQSIKELERGLLKTYKKRLSKIKEDEINETNSHLLYVREGKSPLLVDDICIDSANWYS